jgi:hypothetical protein
MNDKPLIAITTGRKAFPGSLNYICRLLMLQMGRLFFWS